MKIPLVIYFILNFCNSIFAQISSDLVERRPVNNLSLNLFGDASFVSLSYERLFLVCPTFIISSKIGLGFNEEYQLCFGGPCPSPDKFLTIPHHITFNVGKTRDFFEFGLGGTIVKGNTSDPYLLYPIIGYRNMANQSNRKNIRVYALIPLAGIITDDIIIPPCGISLGLAF